MFLRDLAVASWHTAKTDQLRRSFNLSTLVVVESVLARLPRNAVTLDGLAKLNIAVADPATRQYEKSEFDGVGTFHVPDFDFQQYAALSEAQQHEVILGFIEAAFVHVARISNSDASLCLSAVAEVRQLGLPLPKLGSDAFWKTMPERRRRSKKFREDIALYARLLSEDGAAKGERR